MTRLFVALPLPDSIIDVLAPSMEGGPPGLRWVPEDNLHCTIRFIGTVERHEAQDLADALARLRHPPFGVRIDGVGIFTHRRREALWARLVPRAPLEALHEKVDRTLVQLGHAPERRAYLPHVTLARWSGGAIDARNWSERWASLASPAVMIERFTLYRSDLYPHGPHYTPLASFALTG